jgi:RNA polymerase nonessential primary-like sigma factor
MPRTLTVPTDSVRQYLQEIGRYPLLTADQEVEYGRAVQLMLPVLEQRQRLSETLERSPLLYEIAEALEISEIEVQQRLKAGERAKRRLVEANLRLVVSVAKKYQKLNMELLDLLQEGGIGLQRAAEKFDPSKGYRFTTYAYWWIWQAITRAISEKSRTVRLPFHMAEKLSKIRKTQRQLAVSLGRAPSVAELAEATQLKPQQVRECLAQARQPVSLDRRIGDGEKTSLGDLLEDEGLTPEDFATRSCLRKDIDEWMVDALTPQQQQVLNMRYGLVNDDPMTLQEIANQMHLTRERIRQIEQSALKRLRLRQGDMGAYLAG